MEVTRPSVEGPEFARRTGEAEEAVMRLEEGNWDFSVTPEIYAKSAAADVAAKELVHIHDGTTMTRIGRLVMVGVGTHFNLMGGIPSDAEMRVTDPGMLDEINARIGSRGLLDLPGFSRLGVPQEVDFYNYGMFNTLREMVFWLVLHGAGCFPSTLEHMVRHFVAGDVVQNYMYAPLVPSRSRRKPAVMQATCLEYHFPSATIEWMEKPLYGGVSKETLHVETLLTTYDTDISHPYLKTEIEGEIRVGQQSYRMKRFVGTAQKDGVRGPGVPQEKKSARSSKKPKSRRSRK